MENIEARAKNQLLNLEDDSYHFDYESFLLNPPSVREKPKIRTSARVQTSLSSHRETPNFQKQNHKQILKNKLKELLEKDPESPEREMKRIKTIGSLQTAKNSQNKANPFKIYRNEDCSKLRTLEAASIVSLRRENGSGSRKILNPQQWKQEKENGVSIFEEESEKIRRFIKRKIEEKAIKRQKKVILTGTIANLLEGVQQRTKKLVKEKTNSLESSEQNDGVKTKIQGSEILEKIITRQKMLGRKQRGKENLQTIVALSTPLIKMKKQTNLEGRKLRNILF